MKSVHVIIEPGKDGFGVMFKTKGLENLTSFGESLQEAKENAIEVIREVIEYYKESGQEIPSPLKGMDVDRIKVHYSYLLNYYFKEFSYLNISRLADVIGINPSLLRQYDKGLTMASEDKYIKLREGLHTVGRELSTAL